MAGTLYSQRREKAYDWMAREEIALAMIEDTEGRRDSNLRWLCGMPQDALLFLSVERKSLLVPWDINLARLYADAEMLRAYAEFDRLPVRACKKAAEIFGIPRNSRIEIPSSVSYPAFLGFVGALDDFDLLCRDEDGLGFALEKMRAIKDDEEIGMYRHASAITNEIIDTVQARLLAGKIQTEYDAARLVDEECRIRGCEGTGFETLAAGPGRSFSIHPFPAYTASPFGTKGLSILDFGVKHFGYTTDVTLTIARDPDAAQEKCAVLVEKAHRLALGMAGPGTPARSIASAVEAFFAKSRKSMPHALGHGIGMDPHEAPSLRNREDNGWVLEPGMVIAVEPGLYNPKTGGCRLENDLLITQDGAEILTASRIIRL